MKNIHRPRLEGEDTLIEKIIFWVFMTAIIVMVVWIVTGAEERRATTECLKWKSEAKEYPYFYITKAEKAQCDTYEIETGASVI